MADLRVTTFFQQADYGWSETWWNTGTKYGDIAAKYNTLIDARLNMLSARVSITGVRLATEGVARSSRLLLPGRTVVDGQIYVINAIGKRSDVNSLASGENRETYDQVRACLKVEIVAFGQRLSTRYLAGIPDQVSLTEPGNVDFDHPPNWWAAYTTWTGAVKTNGWRVKYQVGGGDSAIQPVIKWVRQAAAPDLWGAVTSNAATIMANVGDRVIIRGVRMNAKGLRTPSGVQIIDSKVVNAVDATTTFYLRNSQGLDLDRAVSLGTVQLQKFAFVTPTALSAFECGFHKRGGPFRRRRGRSSTRRYVN